MPYSISISVVGMTGAIAHINKVNKYLNNDAGEDVTRAAFNAAGGIFERNFDAEGRGFGVGGWASLADKTVEDRERLGFGGEHPILFRYGELRQAAGSSLRTAGGSLSFTSTDPQGKTVRLELNIGKDGGYASLSGDKAWNQVRTDTRSPHPARPYWFTTATVLRAIRKQAVDTLAHNIEVL